VLVDANFGPGCFSWPSTKYCFIVVHYFNSFVPIAQQAGQAAVLGRLSHSMCLWSPFTSVSTVSRGHPCLVSLAPAIKASLGVIFTRMYQILCIQQLSDSCSTSKRGRSKTPTIQSSSSVLSVLGSRGVVKGSPLVLFLSEPVFVNLLRSPGIDSQPGGPVRQPYFSYRPTMLQRQVESNPRNRFLVSLNVYKYGL
jgi:hypothetical protein